MSQTTRLRETNAPLRANAKVIDARYEVVGRRTIWRRVTMALTAVLWAAAIGFALPQVWTFSTQVGAYFAER